MVPDIVHPLRFDVRGIGFEVVAFMRLSDADAEKIVRWYVRTNRIYQKEVGKVKQIYFPHDADFLARL